MRRVHDMAAAPCPRGGRAAHQANAIPHRRSACRMRMHGTIRNGMGIASMAAPSLDIRPLMNKLDLLRRALTALFSARFIELQRAARRR